MADSETKHLSNFQPAGLACSNLNLRRTGKCNCLNHHNWPLQVLGVGYLPVSYWMALVVKLVLSVWSNVNWLTVSCFWNWKYTSLCRYLVVSHWFKQWKKYVGFDNWDKYQMGEQNVYPGPVDNSGLLRGKKDKTLLWPSFTQSKTGSLLHRANGDKSKHCLLAPKSRPFGGGCRTLQHTFVFYPLT